MENNIIILALQELLQYEDSSDSSDDDDLFFVANNPDEHLRQGMRIKNYVEVIVPTMPDIGFKSHFRICRSTFEFMLSIVAPSLTNFGFALITPEKQFLIAIWRLATPDSLRSICERFDVARSSALRITRRVTKVITALAPAFIQWPQGEKIDFVQQGFEAICAFPKIQGTIDCTHIYIPAPKTNPEAYVNRKNRHSIQLQGICDHKAMFTHCYVGQVGSVHDQRVFRLSEVYEYLGNEQKFPRNSHLVGDAAYKLQENLMVPFRDNGHLSTIEHNFNFCLSSGRMAIERAFGLLKGRFRSLLHVVPIKRTEFVPQHVIACCVLHNICLIRGDELENMFSENNVHQTRNVLSAAVHADRASLKRISLAENLPIRYV